MNRVYITDIKQIPAQIEPNTLIKISGNILATELKDAQKNSIRNLVASPNCMGILVSGENVDVTESWKNLLGELGEGNDKLERFDIGFIPLTASQMKKILAQLDKYKNLTGIALNGCGLNAESIKPLAVVLQNKEKLQDLALGGNRIGDEGVEAIAMVVEKMKDLNGLELSQNSITIDGIKTIAKSLKNHKKLKILGLGYNKIDDEGAEIIAKALEGNTSLQSLALGGNKIGDKGAKAIAVQLAKMKNIQEVYIWGNDFTKYGAIRLADALSDKSLKVVNITEENSKLTASIKEINEHLFGSSLMSFVDKVVSIAKENKYTGKKDLDAFKNKLVDDLLTLDNDSLNALRQVITNGLDNQQDFLKACAEPLKDHIKTQHKEFGKHIAQQIWKFFATIFYYPFDRAYDYTNDYTKGYAEIKENQAPGFAVKVIEAREKLNDRQNSI